MKTAKMIFYVTLTISIVLLVVGFICPPTGVIDGSVLTAVGELFAFAALGQIPVLIKSGTDIRVKHGNTSIEVDNPDSK